MRRSKSYLDAAKELSLERRYLGWNDRRYPGICSVLLCILMDKPVGSNLKYVDNLLLDKLEELSLFTPNECYGNGRTQYWYAQDKEGNNERILACLFMYEMTRDAEALANSK